MAVSGRSALLGLAGVLIVLALLRVLMPVAPTERARSMSPSTPPEPAASPDVVPPADLPEPPEGSAIRGVVRDALGPVGGTLVSATDWYGGSLTAEARASADGTFAIGPVAEFVIVVAEHQERGVATEFGQPGDFLELWLLPGATLSGTVRARQGGGPISGASVHAGRVAATTDAEGRYVLHNLASTTGAIAVAPGHRQAFRSVTIAPGEARTLDFLLEPGMLLRGVVTDTATGAPIAGAEVAESADRHGRVLGPPDRRTRTDGNGHYVLEGVAADANRVFVCFADGYVAAERESDGSGSLDFALGRGLEADGMVLDLDGRPVSAATVHLHRVREEGGSIFRGGLRSQRTETDTSGRFRFDDVVPGTVAFVALAQGFAPGETSPLDAAAARDVVVRMTRGMTLDVSVLDANALGVAGVALDTGTPRHMGDFASPAYDGRARRGARTDAEGRLRLDGLIPGEFFVTARHPAHGRAYGQVSGKAGETVSLELRFGAFQITGRVVTEGGDPAGGAYVQAFGSNHSEIAKADSLGRFRLAGLPAGSLRVRAERAGAASGVLEVAAGTEGVELKLASQVLRGTVLGARQGPLGTFAVSAIRKTPRTNTTLQVEGGDGSFEEPLPPGTYDVTARAPGHRPQTARGVLVQAGVDLQPLDFVLEAAAALQGTARGRDGRPLAYAWVTASPAEPASGAQGGNDRTDQEGRYSIDGLSPGPHTVVLNGGHNGSHRAHITLPAAGTATLDLRLGPTGSATVQVVDAEGNPVPRAYVTFLYAEHSAYAGEPVFTDEEGKAVSGSLPAEVALLARAELRDARAETEVRIGQGGTAEARIVLPGK
jgi:protocatechuate 3,4-dioxygenase beta subunit